MSTESTQNNGSALTTEGKETTTTQANTTQPPAEGSTSTASWRDSLPDDIKNDPSLNVISDITGLAKSYVHSQRMIGADKIVVPGKNATDEDWKGVFRKLGVPESLDKYSVEVKELAEQNPEFFNEFKKVAHSLNVLPRQAEGLAKFYIESAKKTMEQAQQKQQTQMQENLKTLQAEWGQAYKPNMVRALRTAEELGGQEFVAYLDESGLGNDARLIKFLNSVGESMKEDNIPPNEGGGDNGAMTPAQAQRRITDIMGDQKHPYWDPSHPSHSAAVKEVQELYAMSSASA